MGAASFTYAQPVVPWLSVVVVVAFGKAGFEAWFVDEEMEFQGNRLMEMEAMTATEPSSTDTACSSYSGTVQDPG